MIDVPILNFSSPEEIIRNAEEIIETFKSFGVVAIRGANLTVEQQVFVTKALGDITGWVPNNSTNFEQQYVENHKRLANKEETPGDQIVLGWHMEHVEYDHLSPIIGGSWNMVKFTADPETGRTYFVNTAKLYDTLSDSDKEFLLTAYVLWSEPGDTREYVTKAVRPHWLTGEPTLRFHIAASLTEPKNLDRIYDREPTAEERSRFVELRSRLVNMIHNDEDIRIIHRWNQGDLLIPDLFKGAHSATGGFNSDQREFIGYWLYPENPNLHGEYEGLAREVSDRVARSEKINDAT